MRRALRRVRGLEVIDERLIGSFGIAASDPLRVCVDVRGTGGSGHELARRMRHGDDVHLELCGEHVVVAVFGLGERVARSGAELVASLERACARLPRASPPVAVARPRHAPPWGRAAMSPRAAFLAARERVPIAAAEGRIAAELAVLVGSQTAGLALLLGFAFALTEGLTSTVSVLGSLYAVTTVVLAALLLDERVAPRQAAGLTSVLAGIALVSAHPQLS